MNAEGLPVKPPFRLYYCPIELGCCETFYKGLIMPQAGPDGFGFRSF